MQIEFNKKGSGACPFCKRKKWCSIHSKMQEALSKVRENQTPAVEAVIYVCPAFDEEF